MRGLGTWAILVAYSLCRKGLDRGPAVAINALSKIVFDTIFITLNRFCKPLCACQERHCGAEAKNGQQLKGHMFETLG